MAKISELLKHSRTYCDGCIWLIDRLVNSVTGSRDYYCQNKTAPMNNLIISNFTGSRNIPIRDWCPLAKTLRPYPRQEVCHYHKSSTLQAIQKWRKIKPLNTFAKIKENTWYHIPPINNDRRRDIFILTKYTASLKFYERGKSRYPGEFMSQRDIAINFMTEIMN